MSFWSVADSKSIGVAILCRPDLPKFDQLRLDEYPGRIIAVASQTTTVVNIYAPTNKKEREGFFSDLERAVQNIQGQWYLAGDFNCVLDPEFDRVSMAQRSARSESPALHHLVSTCRLTDAIEVGDAVPLVPELRLTHYNASSQHGARLDRCYASEAGANWVVRTEVVVPKVSSDHLGLITWLRDPAVQPRQRPLAPLLYPIRARDPAGMARDIGDELERVLDAAALRGQAWDVTVLHISEALLMLKRREQTRARRAVKKWERKLRSRIQTREELIEYEQGRLARQLERKHGARLLRGVDATVALAQRLAQRAPRLLSAIDGAVHLSTADKFATKWSPLLTARHATCPATDTWTSLNQLCTIPLEHVLEEGHNAALMAVVSWSGAAAAGPGANAAASTGGGTSVCCGATATAGTAFADAVVVTVVCAAGVVPCVTVFFGCFARVRLGAGLLTGASQGKTRPLRDEPRAAETAAGGRITTEEVLVTIKDLGAHKAGGADRLNNDFYRDWADQLAPALVLEFNKILTGAAMPVSFGEAVIVPLPKNGNSSNPMDYRPISLLQSSYKILTKLLASRLQSSLGRVINADQNGFVRGRDMANNIFLMQAILAQAHDSKDTEVAESPVAVLLDFKKAYDTLDRGFLAAALQAFGYSTDFIRLVQRLHAGTTARFLANGDLSAPISVQTGIRQGCPLAPLLFLVAAETLKYAVAQTPGLQGITLSSAGVEFQHSFSAFVDDSVVFVARGEMLRSVETTLRVFAELSGLQVQPTKSHAFVLNRQCTATTIGAFPIVPPGETAPYLGTEIGLSDTSAVNWEKRITKLERSLGAASRLTTSLQDRVTVLNTVGLPAVLFTAKFVTPAPPVLPRLDALWRQYLWNGTVSSSPIRAHKLAQPILALPQVDLGLGLRDYREAMVDQAARTILHWNTRSRDKYWAALHMILQDTIPKAAPVLHCYPSKTATTAPGTFDGTMPLLRAGWIRVNASLVGRYPVPAAITTLKSDALTTSAVTVNGLWWTSSTVGRIQLPAAGRVDWTHVSSVVYSSMPHEIRSFWTTFPWADNAWVTDGRGHALKKTDFPSIAIASIGDLNLQPAGERCFTFTNPCAQDPFRLRQTQRKQLAAWLQIIIVNSGFHYADPVSWSTDRVYSLNAHATFDRYEWHLMPATCHPVHHLRGRPLQEKWSTDGTASPHGAGSIWASVTAWGRMVTFTDVSGANQVHQDFRSLCDDLDGAVILAGHPRVHHGPALVIPKTHYRQHRVKTELRHGLEFALCVRRRRDQALRLLIERLERTEQRDPDLQSALRTSTINDLQRRAEGETAYQAMFRYRLALGALNLCSQTGERLACPHDWCTGTSAGASLTHILWSCAAAQRTWHLVHKQWTQRQRAGDQAVLLRALLGADVPVLARDTRSQLANDTTDIAVQTEAQRTVWRMIQAIVPHQLWLHRNAVAFRDATESVHSVAAKTWAVIEKQVDALAAAKRLQGSTYESGVALGALMRALNADCETHVPDARQVRLYYDGGARGNPGCSGAGSLLVERQAPDDQWTIVWWMQTYLGANGTNNVAEHTALAQGLEEAATRYRSRNVLVTAVGDSMLATRQLTSQYRVTSPHLADPYCRSRVVLNDLFDYSFQHTLRTGNKAADWLANAAMDQKTTCHSASAPVDFYAATMSALEPLVRRDTAHAWATTSHAQGFMHQIQAKVPDRPHDDLLLRKRPRPIALHSTPSRSRTPQSTG